jgi:hydrogenase nickel incorporation protein HypB
MSGAEPTGNKSVRVLENLLAENDRIATHVRDHFDDHRILAVNLMSSPGAGKTCLLEATIDALPPGLRVAVIEGDLETENDAERIRGHGVRATQITTGIACHLDATMVHDALHGLSLHDIDILFIENVGNLVCPADFDIGQHCNVVLLAVTEGDDKPEKYPPIFRGADIVLITKTDLLPYLDEFDLGRACRSLERVRGAGRIAEVSAKTGSGLDKWIDWLVTELAAHRSTPRCATAA